jgi:hypothetical protein
VQGVTRMHAQRQWRPIRMMSHVVWIITRLVHLTSGLRVLNRNGQASGSPASISAKL